MHISFPCCSASYAVGGGAQADAPHDVLPDNVVHQPPKLDPLPQVRAQLVPNQAHSLGRAASILRAHSAERRQSFGDGSRPAPCCLRPQSVRPASAGMCWQSAAESGRDARDGRTVHLICRRSTASGKRHLAPSKSRSAPLVVGRGPFRAGPIVAGPKVLPKIKSRASVGGGRGRGQMAIPCTRPLSVSTLSIPSSCSMTAVSAPCATTNGHAGQVDWLVRDSRGVVASHPCA